MNIHKGSRLSDNMYAKIVYDWQFIMMFIILMHAVDVSNGHGRLIEPPSRSSAFRYGFQTPPNYNDHELYCGGFARQQRNGGKVKIRLKKRNFKIYLKLICLLNFIFKVRRMW